MERYERLMTAALRLAAKGAGWVAPNPMVGALVVRESNSPAGGDHGEQEPVVLGKGYHRRYGGAHAEVEALADCRRNGHDPKGATMIVTLEPCCHHGKTPPCTDAIIQAGIRRVVIAMQDRCRLVSGNGVTILREHGIDVVVGCCEQASARLNAGFFKREATGKPLVILKWAQSLDGRLAWPMDAQQRWITGETARRHVHRVRRGCGAILVGINTILADDPLLNVRSSRGEQAASHQQGDGDESFRYARGPQPIRVVMDSELKLPLSSRVVRSADRQPLLVFCREEAETARAETVAALGQRGIEVIPTASRGDGIDAEAALVALGERGVNELLVEGGARVLRSFWEQQLADRVMVYVAPVIIGGDMPRIDFHTTALERLTHVETRSFADELLIAGDVPAYHRRTDTD